MSAIQVLKKDIISYEEIRKSGKKCLTTNNEECCFVHYPEIKEALLALEKQKNGLKCIGCGSIPKLKLCCNSCYQRLKLKEKRQVELIEWLEKEIESTGNRLKNAQLNGNSKRQTTSMTRIKALREVLERVGEQK